MSSTKTYRLVRPRSLNDSAFEEFEYLIRWVGRDGSDYLYMFLDAEFDTKIRNNTINEIDEDRIETLVDSENRSVMLKADNLSKSDLLIIGELLASKFVTRLLTDGTTERYVPDSNSYKYRLMNYKYSVSFSLVMASRVVWK